MKHSRSVFLWLIVVMMFCVCASGGCGGSSNSSDDSAPIVRNISTNPVSGDYGSDNDYGGGTDYYSARSAFGKLNGTKWRMTNRQETVEGLERWEIPEELDNILLRSDVTLATDWANLFWRDSSGNARNDTIAIKYKDSLGTYELPIIRPADEFVRTGFSRYQAFFDNGETEIVTIGWGELQIENVFIRNGNITYTVTTEFEQVN
ncbi:MAG: hypothetical protein IJR85_04245 [Synergistaceae bacterium]|nr:hypothetical protein [Synergistaceae bacterium]